MQKKTVKESTISTRIYYYQRWLVPYFSLFSFSHVDMACGIIHVVLKKVAVVVRRTSKGTNKQTLASW